jgi:hypothetical protein
MNEMESLELYSHRLNIESRIARLEKEAANAGDTGWFATGCAILVVLAMNYFVV